MSLGSDLDRASPPLEVGSIWWLLESLVRMKCKVVLVHPHQGRWDVTSGKIKTSGMGSGWRVAQNSCVGFLPVWGLLTPPQGRGSHFHPSTMARGFLPSPAMLGSDSSFLLKDGAGYETLVKASCLASFSPAVFMDCQTQHPCFFNWEAPINPTAVCAPVGGRQL